MVTWYRRYQYKEQSRPPKLGTTMSRLILALTHTSTSTDLEIREGLQTKT